jgi:hypothetical protein
MISPSVSEEIGITGFRNGRQAACRATMDRPVTIAPNDFTQLHLSISGSLRTD